MLGMIGFGGETNGALKFTQVVPYFRTFIHSSVQERWLGKLWGLREIWSSFAVSCISSLSNWALQLNLQTSLEVWNETAKEIFKVTIFHCFDKSHLSLKFIAFFRSLLSSAIILPEGFQSFKEIWISRQAEELNLLRRFFLRVIRVS